MSLRQRLKMQQQVGAFKFSWRSWSHSTALWLLLINISLLALICHPDVTLTSQAATTLSQSVDEIKIVLSSVKPHSSASTSSQQRAQSRSDHDDSHAPPFSEQSMAVRRDFAVELLKMLHEQHGRKKSDSSRSSDVMENRQSPGQLGFGPQMMNQLLEALGADGDMRRLIDWVRNSFNLASIPELTTQFVVGKLGSVNCPALLKPDKEESLVPRFLLFNEHYTDVPFELSINPDANECITNGKFDPRRKTVVLVHGYLAGYTLLDGITNIKNRLLDLNRQANDKAMGSFMSQSSSANFVYTEDLNQKIRQQLYNVVIVDWFNGANPTPRANYIRAAVNAQVVGRLMARFLSSLVVQCGTPSSNIQIIAHSLGCHVSGFTGKAMNAAGHRLGRITHLDPVGLCFGRLFSQPRFRLSPDDALDTQAVHVSLNIFDNPLDGVHSNFLVNGGRDQVGCTGQSELKNSTTSSVSLLFHPAAKFAPCSHLKALALFEDDHSSEPGQCQMVGYRCQNYDRFLAGKCGHCDATNSQCRLMSLPPLAMQFRTMSLAGPPKTRQPLALNSHLFDFYPGSSLQDLYGSDSSTPRLANITFLSQPKVGLNATRTGASQATSVSALAPLHGTVATSPAPLTTEMFGAPSFLAGNYLGSDNNELAERSDRRLSVDKRDRIAQALEKLRSETRTAFSGSWSSLRASHLLGTSEGDLVKSNEHEESSESDMHEITTTTNEANRGPRTTTTPSPTTQTSSVPTTLAGQLRTTTGQGESWLADQSSSSRLQQDPVDQIPIGSQKIPSGSMHGPLFFLGTGAMAPYCVNYYQFRVLISEWRLQRILKNNGLGSNRLAPQLSQHKGGLIKAATALQQRVANASGRDMLHLTVKLSDSSGRFFKGFSMLEEVHSLGRVMNDFAAPSPLPLSSFGDGPSAGLNEPMVELTMLLNSTRTEPQRIGETIISYYFHQIVLADRVEINYMSNISPEIRAKYSSVLCPVAINDRHQLVKYIECRKVTAL